MINEFQNLLNKELSKRTRKNPSYSLRAFAKHLEVSPSALSAMMSGKRPITKKSVQNLGLRMGLSIKKIEEIILGLNLKLSSTTHKLPDFHEIKMDQLSILSDWYNLTILELMKLKDFQPNENYIASKLGISIFDTRSAIDVLQRTGILEITKKGQWIDKSAGFTHSLPKEETTAIKKRLQQQFFEKALQAISDIEYSKRDHTGMTMAIAEEDLPLARTLITKFRRELSQLLESRGKPNQVYHLSIGLFPFTKEIKKIKEQQ
jgi:transcriptional regulator with XRE-family HTH domain